MNLRDIEYFGVVAEQRNLSRAAEVLDLSISALSKSLRRLEASLGTKLVRRTPRGVELTTEGSALHLRAKQLQVSLHDIAREVEDLGQGRVGHLRIGSLTGFEYTLRRACSASLRAGPRLCITLTLGNNDVLVPALRHGALDLIIAAIPDIPYDDLVQEQLVEGDTVPYVRAGHRLTKVKRLRINDLIPERWVLGASDPNFGLLHNLNRAFLMRGLPLPGIAFMALASGICGPTVADTDLLGYGSRMVLERTKVQLRLVELPVKELHWHRRVAITYRKATYLSPAARAFIANLKDAVQEL